MNKRKKGGKRERLVDEKNLARPPTGIVSRGVFCAPTTSPPFLYFLFADSGRRWVDWLTVHRERGEPIGNEPNGAERNRIEPIGNEPYRTDWNRKGTTRKRIESKREPNGTEHSETETNRTERHGMTTNRAVRKRFGQNRTERYPAEKKGANIGGFFADSRWRWVNSSLHAHPANPFAARQVCFLL